MVRSVTLALALLASSSAQTLAADGDTRAARREAVQAADVVVVKGSADHIEQVLARAKVNFALVSAAELAALPVHGEQVLMVNCLGQLPPESQERVRRFVRAGGFLYTTDHAVKHLIEPLFPGYIRFARTTTEAVFPMQTNGDRGLLKHLAEDGPPRWQLASGGHLFEVVNKKKVEVLMRSDAVARQYGHGALGVRFRVEDGQVIHVAGHFFTQPGQQPGVAAAGRAFEQLSSNVVDAKKQDKKRLQRLYNVAPRRSVQLRAAPAEDAAPVPSASGPRPVTTKQATRVRVLEERGDYSRIRDAEGNEGWVESDAL